VDGVVTCLVGKNESGKTNILHALHTLNPAHNDRDFDEQQYPRWLQKEHQRSGEFASAEPIRVDFELDDTEVAAIEEHFGEEVLRSKSWSVGVRYDGEKFFSVEVDEEAACKAIELRMGTDTGAVKLAALRTELDDRAAETEPDASGAQVATETAQLAQEARAEVDRLFPESKDLDEAICYLLVSWMPRFFYFDEYSQLRGRTRIEPLIEALKTDTVPTLDDFQRTALALLRLGFAGTDLVDPNYEKRSGEMEAVAADLTRQVQRYWHQNDHLRLRIDIEPEEETRPDGVHVVNRFLQLRVEDDRHFFTNNLDVRSSGFRWFISFLAAFKEFYSDRAVIVLLDEPALGLHARAQRDFLEFIEDTLAQEHQVLYTTHSPFMVDPAHLERVRVVEDMGPDEGARVKAQLMSRDPDTLSPLQGALGYDIAQNIFVGPDNLVVEGLSDYTYLVVISEVLRAGGRDFLDPRWRVLPAGGAGTMPAVVSLLGQELDVTVVVDGGSQPPQKLNGLVGEGILDSRRIIMLGPIAGKRNADIEDLFDPEDYFIFYNGALGSSLASSDLDAPEDRIIKRIERAAGEFNHNDPSNWLLANRQTATASLRSATLDRFEQLIRAINGTLRRN
jgi:energy-coupling factor transporter ATP-binding protein EcfA2